MIFSTQIINISTMQNAEYSLQSCKIRELFLAWIHCNRHYYFHRWYLISCYDTDYDMYKSLIVRVFNQIIYSVIIDINYIWRLYDWTSIHSLRPKQQSLPDIAKRTSLASATIILAKKRCLAYVTVINICKCSSKNTTILVSIKYCTIFFKI